MILQIIVCSLIGSMLAVIGGIILTSLKNAKKISAYLTAFAAGVLLSAAILDLLPEAAANSSGDDVFYFVLIGLVAFFVLEGFLRFFHSHGRSDKKDNVIKPIVPLIVIGDTVHNFIDGVAIAAGFLISPAHGIVVTLAVAAHEIPQEIGDFAVLINSGVKRKKVIIINILSALASTVSAVAFYLIGSGGGVSLTPMVGITVGFFVYVATTDIIPAILQQKNQKDVAKKSALLLIGIVTFFLVSTTLHGIIE